LPKLIWVQKKEINIHTIRREIILCKIKEITAGSIRVGVFESRIAMGKAAAVDAAARIHNIIDAKGQANVVFAAAPSQNEFLAELQKQDVDWSKINAFHMDEYIGLQKNAPQGFGNFLKEAIFGKVPFKSISYIDNQNEDPEIAAQNYEKLLTENSPDLVFLGIGENGHLAFNDPHVADFNDPKKVKTVRLAEICRNQQVNDGCFEKFDDVPANAITLTMSMLMSIPEVLVIVPGSTKSEAVYRTVYEPISTACPATILRTHKGTALYTERDAGAKLL